jgi:hypothetical protein
MLRHLGLQHPELLFDPPGNLDVDVLRDRFLSARGNRFPERLRHTLNTHGQLAEEAPLVTFVNRKRPKRATVDDGLQRTTRDPAECNGALGYKIDIGVRFVCESVEQQVHLRETRPEHVPLGLFVGHGKVRQGRKIAVEPQGEFTCQVPIQARCWRDRSYIGI